MYAFWHYSINYRYVCSLSIVRPSRIYMHKPLKATWRRCLSRQKQKAATDVAVQLTVLITLAHSLMYILIYLNFENFFLFSFAHEQAQSQKYTACAVMKQL